MAPFQLLVFPGSASTLGWTSFLILVCKGYDIPEKVGGLMHCMQAPTLCYSKWHIFNLFF